MAVTLQKIIEGSPAEKYGLQPGMVLCKINGHEISDGLDYEYHSVEKILSLDIRVSGEAKNVTVSKEEYEPLGCQFATYLIDKQHRCRNQCIFCFVDQLPKGMRQSLYFKDDDERLSFLFGNYITLTNLTQHDINRIMEMRISPINISIHTANPALRIQMMKNKRAGEVLGYIAKLADAGIKMNLQLVLCPGINDGNELAYTIGWLAQYRPSLESIAVVPVGITKHRQGLPVVRGYSSEEAARQLDIMLEFGDQFTKHGGLRLVYPSDEWFVLTDRKIPKESFYDGYPQLENGVGMWRSFHDEFYQALEEIASAPCHTRAIVTGVMAAPLFRKFADSLHEKFPSICLEIHTVQNKFFGEGVSAAGLLTGQDIITQLDGRLRSNRLLLSENMLRTEKDCFLDNVTPAQIEASLGLRVRVVAQNGAELLRAILEE